MSTEERRSDPLPVIGVFTKQLDNWTSGSGHHLNEIMNRILDRNEEQQRFHFVFIHYAPSTNPIYKRVEELIIPRNPVAATLVLRKWHFDILHYTPLTAYSPIWGLKAKKVATIHGAEQLIVPRFYGTIEMLHERFLVPIYARQMDHIITVSYTSRGFFMGRYRIPGERITVCYNGVSPLYRRRKNLPSAEQSDPDFTLPKATSLDSLLSRYGLRVGDPFIFHLSRFSERKNPWTILEGFRRFLSLLETSRSELEGVARGFKLVIGGTRWDSKEVDTFLDQAGIADRVIRTGFLKEEESVAFYNAASVFVFPSLAEGFGMPNIEAMACGCPVITSGVFAIPEVVGDAAWIVQDPEDPEELATALVQVVTRPEVRNRLVEAGFKRLELFDWDKAAEKVIRMYEGLGKNNVSRS
ncbi:MAG: glycosyltransferase family 4 protein [Spirochaetales bacterium]|nr:glycosyltransferase family 4 protein [Spirochaetales bacterium]